MKTAFRIFWRDLKRICKNPVALIVTIGVAIIPAMYAWFNVAASWDPYGNTSNIKVAVVNADKGATDDLVGELNAGELVMDALHENSDLGWVYEDAKGNALTEESAKEGVERGAYYAAIVVPKDFSSDLLTITSGTYTKPDIIYYVNEKHNTVAPEITNVGAETIQTQISEEFISTVSGVITDKLEGIISNTEDTTNNATSTIASRIQEAAGSLDGASGSLSGLSGTLAQSRTACSDAKGSVSSLQSMLGDTSSTLADATNQLSGTRTASNQLQNKVSGNLAQVNTTLGTLAGVAGSDIANYASKIASAQGAVQGACTQVSTVVSYNTKLINEIDTKFDEIDGKISKIDAQIAEIDAKLQAGDKLTDEQKAELQAQREQLSSLRDKLTDLRAKLKETYSFVTSINSTLGSAASDLDAASKSIEASTTEMSGNSDKITSTIKGSLNSVTSDTNELVNSVFPAVNAALDTFSHASGNLSGALSGLDPVLEQAQGILSELDSTLAGADTSVTSIQNSLSDVAGTLNRVASDISTISLADLTSDLDNTINANAQSVANFMVSPVEINTEVMYEVEKYGAAAAPFYTNLAIWVGGFVLIAIYKQEVDREGLEQEGQSKKIRPWQAYLGRLFLYLVVGQLQAIIVCVGDVVMGIQCISPVAFVFAGMVQSFVYINIIFALAVAFKHIGKALAVVIVILQIPGSSGLYPIEMMPDFFRNVEPWLPFTYGIRAMRESIAGFYGNHYAVALLQLLAFVIPALLLGMAARRRLVNINALFDKRLAKTELMVCEHESLENNEYSLRSIAKVLRQSSYADKAEARANHFEELYPKLARYGVLCLICIPVGLLILLFAIDAKETVLMIWVMSCILICSALIVIEYLHDSFERKNDLAHMSQEDVRSLLDSKLKGGE